MLWVLMMIILSCIAILWNNLTVYSELYFSSNLTCVYFWKDTCKLLYFHQCIYSKLFAIIHYWNNFLPQDTRFIFNCSSLLRAYAQMWRTASIFPVTITRSFLYWYFLQRTPSPRHVHHINCFTLYYISCAYRE